MELISEVHIETPRGIRAIDLRYGNVVMPLAEGGRQVDLLALSAYKEVYKPSSGTVIAALAEQHNLSVGDLADDPLIDLRRPLGCWISHELSGLPFRRILCVFGGSFDGGSDLTEVFAGRLRSCFRAVAVLEAWDAGLQWMAMPLLGTGRQGLPPAQIMPAFLDAAISTLMHSLTLERISIVETDSAKVEAINLAMDTALGRHKIVLGKNPLANLLRKRLITILDSFQDYPLDEDADNLLTDLSRLLRPEMTLEQLGLWCRHFVEYLVFGVMKAAPLLAAENRNPAIGISVLKERGIVDLWVADYLHHVRVVANRTVHRALRKEHAANSQHTDLEITLLIVARLLDFWKRTLLARSTDLSPAS